MTTPSTKLAKLEKKLLHYTGKAIADFNMIQKGDRVMVTPSISMFLQRYSWMNGGRKYAP